MHDPFKSGFMTADHVFQHLDRHNILYKIHKHQPVYTVEEAKGTRSSIPGMHSKNLFLKDKKRENFFLLTAPADKDFKLNSIRKAVKAKNLSFGSSDELEAALHLTPGAVSPFGLINTSDISYLIDEDILNASIVSFHPNDNSMTLELSDFAFLSYLETLNVPIIKLRLAEDIAEILE